MDTFCAFVFQGACFFSGYSRINAVFYDITFIDLWLAEYAIHRKFL